MSPEQKQVAELTTEQLETADYFLEACGLQDVANTDLEMMGQSGSVRYGLGRCAEYLMDRTPEEIREMVMTKLDAQKHTT
jgi:hypothetical protein